MIYSNVPISFPIEAPTEISITSTTSVPAVPFYSQFADIQSAAWQKKGCGIASLSMIINYYKPGAVTTDNLLIQGIDSGAFVKNAGWSHQGLANLASRYGLVGKTYDLSKLGSKIAFGQLKEFLKDGPVIVSVFNKFDPKSTIPHLVVINGVDGDTVYYNDPSANAAGKRISTADFLRGWKKRFITITPVNKSGAIALLN